MSRFWKHSYLEPFQYLALGKKRRRKIGRKGRRNIVLYMGKDMHQI